MIDDQRQSEHECCSKQWSPDTGDSADDDGCDELDRKRQAPVIGDDIATVWGKQRACDASQEWRQDERAHLRLKQVDTHNGCACFIIAHRSEGAPGARTHDVEHEESRQH